jgi:HK97 family phage portal protein
MGDYPNSKNSRGLVSRITSGFRGLLQKRSLPVNYTVPFSIYGYESDSGQQVTASTALTISAVFAAVRNIAEDIGKIPFSIYKEIPGRSREEQRQLPQWWAIYMASSSGVPSYVLKQSLIQSAMLNGDGFAFIKRDDFGRPMALYYLPYVNVQVMINEANEIGYRITNSVGFMNVPAGVYAATEIIHLRGMTLNGITGMSVIQYGANSFGGALSAQKLGNDTFKNGSNLGGTIEYPGALTDQARTNLENSFNAAMQGAQGSQRWKVLEEGTKANAMKLNLEDYQLLETKKFNVQDVARWFRIPLHKIQDMSGSTFSNIEQENIAYVTDTLMPWVTKLEDEFTLKLLTVEQRINNVFVYAHTNELTRGDMAARATYYKEMTYIGAITTNEIRWEEWMNAVQGGDRRFIPANMAIIEPDGTIHPPTDPNQPTPVN